MREAATSSTAHAAGSCAGGHQRCAVDDAGPSGRGRAGSGTARCTVTVSADTTELRPGSVLRRRSGLQVPHGRCRRPSGRRVGGGRESVAVPYDVGEGADVPAVLAVAASGHGQALSAAKSPVQVAGPGLECHRRQLGGGEPDACLSRLQLAQDRFGDVVVHGTEGAASQRLLRDRRPWPVMDRRSFPLEEVRQEISRRGETGQREPMGHPGAQGLVGCERVAIGRWRPAFARACPGFRWAERGGSPRR